MKWLNSYKIKLMVTAFLIAIVHGAISTEAHIIMSDPVSVGPPIFQGSDPQGCDFSADGLELYFASTRPGGSGSWDIWVSKRGSLNGPWQEPVNLGSSVNNGQGQVYPAISPDGLEIYFDLWQQPYLYVARRASRQDPWSAPEKVLLFADDELNRYSGLADVSADGLSLYFSTRSGFTNGSLGTWVAHRDSPADPWSEPVELGLDPTGTLAPAFPSITADGLTLVFGADQSAWLWAATRSSVEDAWGPPVDLGFESLPNGYDAAISPDGSTLYIDVHPPNLLQVTFQPIVDLDGDGIVGIEDLKILIDHWDQEGSTYDLAPLPLGDNIVNIKDLEMLMSYWGQSDPTLVAHWTLDEAEGEIAHDSIEGNDGLGPPDLLWRPEGGKVGGALELDGIDDSIVTTFSLNPAQTTFSAFVWIKEGGPDQVALSQNDGVNWLLSDSEGQLMTSLRRGSSGPTLVSEYVITEGDWHHIGVVWDGSHRHLYADGIEVAEDTTDIGYLSASNGNLCIGCGYAFDAGSFFSGLIDDVRIYNRAVSP